MLNSPLKKIYYCLSAVILFFFFLCQKFILIRIGYFYRDKIGHLVGNTQIYLYKKKNKKNFYYNKKSLFEIDLWIGQRKIIYPLIENFYKKKVIILPQILLLGVYNLASKYPFLKKFLIEEHDWGYDFFNLNYRNKIENILTKKQNIFAEDKLKKIFVYPNNKIAVIINRNNFFNKNIMKNENIIKNNSYRNSNFNDYLLAAKYLAKKGYKVLRMGSHDKNFKNKYVINYSSSKIRDLIIDLYLLKKAKIIISSGTGIDNVASMFFKKKICYVNCIPFLTIQSIKFTPGGVFMTRKLSKNNKLLSLKDIIQKNYFTKICTMSYKKSGIKIINNSRKEILHCVKEFYKLNFKKYKYSKKELILQKKFYKILNENISNEKNYRLLFGNYDNFKIAKKQKPLANFSSHFLSNNQWFLKN